MLRTAADDNFHARWLKNDWLNNQEFIDVAAEWRSSAERSSAAQLETQVSVFFYVPLHCTRILLTV
jgi:hypothetical protein